FHIDGTATHSSIMARGCMEPLVGPRSISCPLLALSGHALLHCMSPFLTQSGHYTWFFRLDLCPTRRHADILGIVRASDRWLRPSPALGEQRWRCQMRQIRRLFEIVAIIAAVCCVLGLVNPAFAQGAPQAAGGSMVLPVPQPQFGGIIGRKASESKPDFPKAVAAPKGAPNILLILTDDTGFGAASTFGGPIPTPTLDREAQGGLRYNNFHTTALCSPTRAALLTGRNHHSVGFGNISEFATGYPGYNSILPKSAGTIANILVNNGYNTSWFGKNHLIPDWLESPDGPFDQWPSGLGFEYFYGFLGGDTDNWHPA